MGGRLKSPIAGETRISKSFTATSRQTIAFMYMVTELTTPKKDFKSPEHSQLMFVELMSVLCDKDE